MKPSEPERPSPGESDQSRDARLVEAAGIEPASEKVRTIASTRLADSVFYLTSPLLNGKPGTSQPVSSRGDATGVTPPPARISVAL